MNNQSPVHSVRYNCAVEYAKMDLKNTQQLNAPAAYSMTGLAVVWTLRAKFGVSILQKMAIG